VFAAHETALAALAMNASGKLIATASERGTVMKVFQSSDGQLLYRLRRSTRPAVISSITFRSDDRFLAVASTTSTVHVFKLDHSTANEQNSDRTMNRGLFEDEVVDYRPGVPIERLATGIQEAVKGVASLAASGPVGDVVKGVMPLYFNDLRSFAQFHIPDVDSNGHTAVDARGKQARIVGPQVAFHPTAPRLFVLHYNGILYESSFRLHDDPKNGVQECRFIGATTWFAVRPDFKIQDQVERLATVSGGSEDGDDEVDKWQLL